MTPIKHNTIILTLHYSHYIHMHLSEFIMQHQHFTRYILTLPKKVGETVHLLFLTSKYSLSVDTKNFMGISDQNITATVLIL